MGNLRLANVEVEFSSSTLGRVKFASRDDYDELQDKREERCVLLATVQFIEVLCRCNAFKEMVISNVTQNAKRLSKSCSAFRGKDVDIFVGGVQYLPYGAEKPV